MRTILFLIGGLALTMILGGIIQLLKNKFPENKYLQWGALFFPTPYNLMRLYVSSQELEGFEKVHSKTGLSYIFTICLVSGLAWWADQQVMYGIEFMSSRDDSFAFWQGCLTATVIQILLLFNGGMAIKLWVNNLHKSNGHAIQFKIHTLLSSIGLACTLVLSFMTYSISETKGIQGKENVKSGLQAERDSTLALMNGEGKSLRKAYLSDSMAYVVPLYEELAADTVYWNDRAESKKAEGLSWSALNKKLKSYKKYEAKSQKKIKGQIRHKLDSIQQIHAPQQRIVDSRKMEFRHTADSLTTLLTGGLDRNISTSGWTTMGRNILLNLIALFFNFGLQFHIKYAVKERGEKKTKEVAENAQDRYEEEPEVEPTPQPDPKPRSQKPPPEKEVEDLPFEEVEPEKKEEEPEVTPENLTPEGAIPNDRPSVERKQNPNQTIPPPIGGRGGTPLANTDLFWDRLKDGTIKVLYRGRNGDNWWGYTEWRTALQNRKKRFLKSQGQEAKDTQLAWILVLQNKLKFIEANDSKKRGTRLDFDQKNPHRDLFPK